MFQIYLEIVENFLRILIKVINLVIHWSHGWAQNIFLTRIGRVELFKLTKFAEPINPNSIEKD